MNNPIPEMLIDVREYPEFAAAHIAGSRLVPLASLAHTSAAWNRHAPLTLVCKNGRRAGQAHRILTAAGFTALTVLDGGLERWQNDGNPVLQLPRRPWAMERQVRAVAGSLILLFMTLAWLISPLFLFGAALIGAGLLFAALTDTCMMATVLARLPWNKSQACTQGACR